MHHFAYRDGVLHAEDVSLAAIADAAGTPVYVYSTATLERHYRVFSEAFAGMDALVCYAVKANGNLAVLRTLAEMGGGADIVSGGELERVLAAGGDAGKVVFSGLGKTEEEMRRALLVGIKCFNVESAAELERLQHVAAEAPGGGDDAIERADHLIFASDQHPVRRLRQASDPEPGHQAQDFHISRTGFYLHFGTSSYKTSFHCPAGQTISMFRGLGLCPAKSFCSSQQNIF